MTPDEGTPSGRPRDPRLTERVLGAVVDLIEEVGATGLTVDRVAHRSGVPKSTIYRRWSSKAELLIDAMVDAFHREVAAPHTGSVEQDLVTLLSRQHRFLGSAVGRLMIQLSAQALSDDTLRGPMRDVARKRRRVLREVLAGGVASGQLAADLDVDRAVDLLAGAVWLRVLGHLPCDRGVLTGLVQCARRGIGPVPA